jgi:hypothetical protein
MADLIPNHRDSMEMERRIEEESSTPASLRNLSPEIECKLRPPYSSKSHKRRSKRHRGSIFYQMISPVPKLAHPMVKDLRPTVLAFP